MALDFNTLTAKEIYEMMEEKATSKQKKAFKQAAFVDVPEKVSVKVFDTNGNPVMFQVKDKAGNLKFKPNGEPVMRQKTQMVEKKGGKTRPVFSLLNAKWWLADNMPEELENLPERSDGEEKPKQGDLFKNW